MTEVEKARNALDQMNRAVQEMRDSEFNDFVDGKANATLAIAVAEMVQKQLEEIFVKFKEQEELVAAIEKRFYTKNN